MVLCDGNLSSSCTCNVSAYGNGFLIESQLEHHLFRLCTFSVLPSLFPASFFQPFHIPRTHVYTYCPFPSCSFYFSIISGFQCCYVNFSQSSLNLGFCSSFFKRSFMMSLSRSVLSVYKCNFVCLCHH